MSRLKHRPAPHYEPRPLQELRDAASQRARQDMRLIAMSVSWVDYADQLSVNQYQVTLAVAAADLWGGYTDDQRLLNELGLANQGVELGPLRENPAYGDIKRKLQEKALYFGSERTLEGWIEDHEHLVARELTATALLDETTSSRLNALGQLADRMVAKKGRPTDAGRTMHLPENFLEVLDGTLKLIERHDRRLLAAPPPGDDETIDATFVRVE